MDPTTLLIIVVTMHVSLLAAVCTAEGAGSTLSALTKCVMTDESKDQSNRVDYSANEYVFAFGIKQGGVRERSGQAV